MMTHEESLTELERLNAEHQYPRITAHGEWADCAEIVETEDGFAVEVGELPHLRAHREHMEELERLRLEAEEATRQQAEEAENGDQHG